MDLKLIHKLILIMKKGGVAELEVDDQKEGVRVRLKRQGEAPPPAAPVVQLVPGSAASPVAHASQAAAAAAPAEAKAPEKHVGHPIPSPMVGTFYRAPAPDAEPFVQVGARVKVDTPLCIIEAMKVMNEIKSEVSGEILEVLVESGEPVEFGQPLFLVKLD